MLKVAMHKLVNKGFLLWLLFLGLGKNAEGSKICKTQTCISVADEIAEFMDSTVDPCDDFNQFACGGYLETADYNSNTWDDAAAQLRMRLERLIKIIEMREEDFEVDQKVRNFYQACEKFSSTLQNDTIGGLSWEEAKKAKLAHEFGNSLTKVGLHGWPYSNDSFVPKDFRWYDIVPKMIEEGLVYTDGRIELPIINVDVGVNDFTQKESILKIDSPDFDDNDRLDALSTNEHYMKLHYYEPKNLLQLMNPNDASLNQLVLNRSLEIDGDLWWISTRSDRRYKNVRDYGLGTRYFQYNQTTLSDLPPLPCGTILHDCSPITWNKFLDSLFKASGNLNVKTNVNQNVLVKDPKYF